MDEFWTNIAGKLEQAWAAERQKVPAGTASMPEEPPVEFLKDVYFSVLGTAVQEDAAESFSHEAISRFCRESTGTRSLFTKPVR